MDIPENADPKLRCVAAYILCGILLHGFAVILAYMCIPYYPEVFLFAYVIVAIPTSIILASKIHQVTYKGIMLIGITQFAMAAWYSAQAAAGWRGVMGMGLEFQDIVESVLVGIAVAIPLVALECAWLFVLKQTVYSASNDADRTRHSV